MTWKADPTPLPLTNALPSAGLRTIEAAGLRSEQPTLRIIFQGRLQIAPDKKPRHPLPAASRRQSRSRTQSMAGTT
jgi:hypothetical protein